MKFKRIITDNGFLWIASLFYVAIAGLVISETQPLPWLVAGVLASLMGIIFIVLHILRPNRRDR